MKSEFVNRAFCGLQKGGYLNRKRRFCKGNGVLATKKWAQRDLNPRPIDYESTALTAELWALDRLLNRNGAFGTTLVPHIDYMNDKHTYQFNTDSKNTRLFRH